MIWVIWKKRVTALKKNLHNRKPTRNKDYDYNLPGYYFVTVCVKDRINLFGKIMNGKMLLNKCGGIINKHIQNLPKYYTNCELDYYVIMPDHLHAIIIVNPSVGDGSSVPKDFVPEHISKKGIGNQSPTRFGSIINIIGYFKYHSTKEINELSKSPGKKIWQRSFYDRVIRNEKELYNIRKYIEQNPLAYEYKLDMPEYLYL